MKVLCTSVLAMEAIIALLAGVMATSGAVGANLVPMLLGLALAVALMLAIGTLRRSWGITAGWVMQGLLVAYGAYLGIFVSLTYGITLLVLGAIFIGLWFSAVRTGTEVDAAKLAHEQGADEPPTDELGNAR